jgi:hypothetical protein
MHTTYWRMGRDGLPNLIMKYQPSGKQSQGRHLKRPLECEWVQKSSQGPNPCKLYDDDDDDDDKLSL